MLPEKLIIPSRKIGFRYQRTAEQSRLLISLGSYTSWELLSVPMISASLSRNTSRTRIRLITMLFWPKSSRSCSSGRITVSLMLAGWDENSLKLGHTFFLGKVWPLFFLKRISLNNFQDVWSTQSCLNFRGQKSGWFRRLIFSESKLFFIQLWINLRNLKAYELSWRGFKGTCWSIGLEQSSSFRWLRF